MWEDGKNGNLEDGKEDGRHYSRLVGLWECLVSRRV